MRSHSKIIIHIDYHSDVIKFIATEITDGLYAQHFICGPKIVQLFQHFY